MYAPSKSISDDTDHQPSPQLRISRRRAAAGRAVGAADEGLDAEHYWRHGAHGHHRVLLRVDVHRGRIDHRLRQFFSAIGTAGEGAVHHAVIDRAGGVPRQ